MAQVIKLVQGDTRPTLKVTITDQNSNDAPVNISGANIRLKFREMDGTLLLDTLTGIVIDGANGVCLFFWNPNTLVNAGDYEGEIEITYEAGSIQTVFDLVYFVVREQF